MRYRIKGLVSAGSEEFGPGGGSDVLSSVLFFLLHCKGKSLNSIVTIGPGVIDDSDLR